MDGMYLRGDGNSELSSGRPNTMDMKRYRARWQLKLGTTNCQVEHRSSHESIRVDDAHGDGSSYDRIIRGKEKGI
jgi:hypothetical protein